MSNNSSLSKEAKKKMAINTALEAIENATTYDEVREIYLKNAAFVEVRIAALKKMILLAKDRKQFVNIYTYSAKFDMELQCLALKSLLECEKTIEDVRNHFSKRTPVGSRLKALVIDRMVEVAEIVAPTTSLIEARRYLRLTRINEQFENIFKKRIFDIIPEAMLAEVVSICNDPDCDDKTRKRAWLRFVQLIGDCSMEELLGHSQNNHLINGDYRQEIVRVMRYKIPNANLLESCGAWRIANVWADEDMKGLALTRIEDLLPSSMIAETTEMFKTSPYKSKPSILAVGRLKELMSAATIEEARAIRTAAVYNKELEVLANKRINCLKI